MQKNKKFKDGSMRLKGWDYGKNADYFLTIKTKYGEHFFGEIKKKREINRPKNSLTLYTGEICKNDRAIFEYVHQ